MKISCQKYYSKIKKEKISNKFS